MSTTRTPTAISATRGNFNHARHRQPLAGSAGRGEPRPAAAHAGRRVRRRRARCCGPRSTWPTPTWSCATRSCTASDTPITTAPATTGASIPNYDWAHGQSDAVEHVTHSLCTLEFENNRELYDWFLDNIDGLPNGPSAPDRVRPARRSPTSSRRSASSPSMVRRGQGRGVGRRPDADPERAAPPRVPAGGDPGLLQPTSVWAGSAGPPRSSCSSPSCATSSTAPALRRMAVLRPLKLVITNWPTEDAGAPVVEMRQAVNNPEDDSAGNREVPFGGELWIERDDFMVDPPKKFFRLAPGPRGPAPMRATSSPAPTWSPTTTARWSRCTAPTIPRPRGARHPTVARSRRRSTGSRLRARRRRRGPALRAPVHRSPARRRRLGDPLDDAQRRTRSRSSRQAKVEPALADTPPGDVVQFERLGYFAHDLDRPMVFHRTVGLRDEWARIQKRA